MLLVVVHSLGRMAALDPALEAAKKALADLETVDVAEGTWKYVLVRAKLGDRERELVRAYRGLKHHSQNLARVAGPLRDLGIECAFVGGGRIARKSKAKTIKVYGYSKTFGRRPGANERAAALLQRHLPDYRVSWSESGY